MGARQSLKNAAFGGIRLLHRALLRRELPQRIAIYGHSLEPNHYPGLRAAVAFFKQHGYTFTGPDEFLSRHERRRVFLSFDDNYRSWFDARGLFDRLGIRVTFYVNAGPLRDRAVPAELHAYYERIRHTGERISLHTDELRALTRDGHVIGSHTDWHLPLTSLSHQQAADSMLHGRTLLEDVLGMAVPDFSYPFGMRRYFNRQLEDYGFSIGMRSIAAAIPGMQYAAQTPRCIHRTGWRFDRPLAYNVDNVRIDGRVFERLTGRSAIG